MNKKYIWLAAIAGFLVALDQVTKLYIHTHFHLGESVVVIPNFFNFTYVRNFGAAFGFLAESHPSFRELFFLSMPPIALIIIMGILRGVKNEDTKQIVALSSIFGGAIGNYIDRIRFRYVIDFLDFHIYGKWSWPAFNIADMAIVGGVGLLLLLMFLENSKKKESEKGA
ncbi:MULTISPECIES: signal peptidase II [unclassified Bdellovibrio]|uniref:signal peptidase II n=1 Tax=unclassified Bdellovibrio TaxID=2633795 RepID=UPI00115A65A7|nr:MULTISPECIES: signal peptidase II [unclassified Bdellovibrio]QDK46820.1 signal peptidase II [Bdellovibrio sp. ZAP7]QLY25025.1 signal peptidase II [Bdellovibrio sp. KM01]